MSETWPKGLFVEGTPRAFATVLLSLPRPVGPGLASAVESLQAEVETHEGFAEEVLGVDGVGKVLLQVIGRRDNVASPTLSPKGRAGLHRPTGRAGIGDR